MRFSLPLASAVLALSWGICEAQTVTLTGTWHLNVAKSKWGNATRPQSVVLLIEQSNAQLHYHGTVTYTNEEERSFGFTGAFDGKPYAMSRSFGDGAITLTRLDPWTFESLFKSDDGTTIESARTSISRDGKTLTRKLRVNSPAGTKSWIEVYDRK